MLTSTFVTDAEITVFINHAIAKLHDLLVDEYEDYMTTSIQFNTVAKQEDYDLSTVAPTFYKLMGVDVRITSDPQFYSLRPFNFNERNRNTDLGWGLIGGPSLRYRLLGSNLHFSPAPDAVYPVRLWYIPVATKLVSGSDVYSDLNQYNEFVELDAAIMCKDKEESETATLQTLRADAQSRVIKSAANRDAGNPQSISDIYAENEDYYFRRP